MLPFVQFSQRLSLRFKSSVARFVTLSRMAMEMAGHHRRIWPYVVSWGTVTFMKREADQTQTGDYLFFDIITDVVFGRTINLLEEPKYRSIIHAIEESNVRISVIVQDPWITLARLDKLLFPTAVIARNMFLRFMRKVVGERLMAERREDIISILLDAKDPETGEGLTLPEIGAEATTLLVAGKHKLQSPDRPLYSVYTLDIRNHI